MARKYDINDFNARVKRINNPRNNAYYDPELKMHVPKHTSQKEIRQTVKRSKINISKILVSLIIGGVAMMAGQALRIRYLGMTEVTDASIFTDILLSLLVMLTLAALMHHRKMVLRVAQVAGAGLMFVAGHNLMWAYPDKLAIVYSPEYVETVRAQTVPMSLVFRDVTISL